MRTLRELLDYIKSKDDRIQETELSFGGQNTLLFFHPSRRGRVNLGAVNSGSVNLGGGVPLSGPRASSEGVGGDDAPIDLIRRSGPGGGDFWREKGGGGQNGRQGFVGCELSTGTSGGSKHSWESLGQSLCSSSSNWGPNARFSQPPGPKLRTRRPQIWPCSSVLSLCNPAIHVRR